MALLCSKDSEHRMPFACKLIAPQALAMWMSCCEVADWSHAM